MIYMQHCVDQVISVNRLAMDWMKNTNIMPYACNTGSCLVFLPSLMAAWNNFENQSAAVFYLQGVNFSQWVT